MTWPHFYQTRSAWSKDQGSNENHSPVHNFAPTVTKFCVMWEGQALPQDTKFGNCRDKIVDSRAFLSWSLILGSSWSGLIKLGPGNTRRQEHQQPRYWLSYPRNPAVSWEWLNFGFSHLGLSWYRCCFTRVGMPIIKIRCFHNNLILIMRIPIHGKMLFILKWSPECPMIYIYLTHCGLVLLWSDTDLGQHWFR